MKRTLLNIVMAMVALAIPATSLADTWAGYRIMIDPGHGGSDPGASGPSAPHEATLALRCGLALKDKFIALGAPYKLTRTTDATLSLSARRSMSLDYDPYIFCSIHLNAYNGVAHGTETWYYWSTGNSQPLANKVHATLISQMGRTNRGVKQNGWTVITGSASIPAILTEGLFVDNYEEWSLIKTEGSTGFNNWVNGHLYGFYDHLKQFNGNITNPRNGVGDGGGSGGTSTPDPTLTLNASSWSFNCEVGKTVIATFSATKANTTSGITVSSNNSNFIVNKVTEHSTGAYFDIKYAPTAAGTHYGTITVKCGGLTKTISVTGTATAPAPAYLLLDYDNWSFNCKVGSTDMATFSAARINTSAYGDVVVTSDNPVFKCTAVTPHDDGAWFNIEYKPTTSGTHTGTLTVTSCGLTAYIHVTGNATAEPIYFKEKWNFSDANGTTTFRGWDATKVRNITYNEGKLYMVYEQKDIKVINAQTGEEIGDLNKVNMFGGTVDVADVKFCDGHLVASNIALAANGDKLRVYKWENDQENPGLLLETDNFGGAPRIGDCIGWQGTWENGKLVFCNDDGSTTRLIIYPITNGRASTTPTVVNVTANGQHFATSSSTRPYPQSDGGYWITGKDCPTTYVNAQGQRQYCIDQDVTWGNAFSWFNWKGQRYGVYTTYEPPLGENLNTQTSEQRAKNYTKGRFKLFSYDGSWDNTTDIYEYPSWGLSDTRQNINCTSDVVLSLTSNAVEIWLLSTNQGLAYYVNSDGVAPSYGLEDIVSLMPAIRPSCQVLNTTAKKGKTAFNSFTISTYRLQDMINLEISGKDADKFGINKHYILKSSDVETITVSYHSDEVGEHEALLTCTSPQAETVTIRLTGQTTEAADLDYNIKTLEDRWSYYEKKGNLDSQYASWFSTDPAQPTRDIALANWKIYALNSKAWNYTPVINIVGAYDGLRRGALNMTGITGGENVLASICNLGGMIIGSNAARCAGFQHTETTTDVLKVYRWYDDSSAPELWLEDPTHGETHVGEIMSVWGDMSNGKVMFSDGSKVLIYTVTSGLINRTAQVVNLTKDGQPYSVGNIKGAAQVVMENDGKFWVVGKDSYPAHFNADGSFIEDLMAVQFRGDYYGTSATIFNIGDRRIMAGTTYLNDTPTRLTGVTDGAMVVMDITNGIEGASTACVYPSDGFGWTVNDTFQSRVLHETSTDQERLNLWALIPMQGVGYYKFDAAQNYINGIGSICSDNSIEGEVRYYDLNGIEVNGNRLAPGIYLRRCGGVTTKVIVK